MTAKITLHPALVKRLDAICRGMKALPPEAQDDLLRYVKKLAAAQRSAEQAAR